MHLSSDVYSASISRRDIEDARSRSGKVLAAEDTFLKADSQKLAEYQASQAKIARIERLRRERQIEKTRQEMAASRKRTAAERALDRAAAAQGI